MIPSKRNTSAIQTKAVRQPALKAKPVPNKLQKSRFRFSDTIQLVLYSALSILIMAGTYHWLSIQNEPAAQETASSSFLGSKVFTPLHTFIDSSIKHKKA